MVVPLLFFAEGSSMEYSEVGSAFSRLVETHFLQRCPSVTEGSLPAASSGGPAASVTVPTLSECQTERFNLPPITLKGKFTSTWLCGVLPSVCVSVFVCRCFIRTLRSGRGKRRLSNEDNEAEQPRGKRARLDDAVSKVTFPAQSGARNGRLLHPPLSP